MKEKVILVGVFLLISFALAQVCNNDGVCTLEEYKAQCLDCVVHNATYHVNNTTAMQTGDILPSWPWWVWGLIGLGIFALVLIGIVVFVVVYIWKKRGKL